MTRKLQTEFTMDYALSEIKKLINGIQNMLPLSSNNVDISVIEYTVELLSKRTEIVLGGKKIILIAEDDVVVSQPAKEFDLAVTDEAEESYKVE